MAESLKQFADELESADDFGKTLNNMIRKTLKAHQRIIFNGNGYDDAWVAEAEKRGLCNLKSTPDALAQYLKPKNVALFTSHGVYTEAEMQSRYEIMLEKYCKVINIEALTMLQMAKRDILPAVSAYSAELVETALSKKALSDKIDTTYEEECAAKISKLTAKMYAKVAALEKAVNGADKMTDGLKRAIYFKDKVFTTMGELRQTADALETITSDEYWPLPSYGKMLFSVK